MQVPKLKGSTPAAYAQAVGQLLAQGASFKGVLAPQQHDAGVKTFLGRTGNIDPAQALDIILAQPACAPHIARNTLVQFCTPDPPASLVTSVATAFRSSNYDIKTLMRTIFTSEAFSAPDAYRSLVRGPAEYMVATMRALTDPTLPQGACRPARRWIRSSTTCPLLQAGRPTRDGCHPERGSRGSISLQMWSPLRTPSRTRWRPCMRSSMAWLEQIPPPCSTQARATATGGTRSSAAPNSSSNEAVDMITRRDFMVSGITATGVGIIVPPVFAKSVFGATVEDVHNVRVLVILQLGGGDDGLNTVIPFADPAYLQARPTIGITADKVLPLNASVGLNPVMPGLKKLFDAGEVAVVQGVGYPKPVYSHFEGLYIWEHADPSMQQTEGWLGKLL